MKILWIQLKCTREPWSVSNVLAENLLYNFILNSFSSGSRGRTWRAHSSSPKQRFAP